MGLLAWCLFQIVGYSSIATTGFTNMLAPGAETLLNFAFCCWWWCFDSFSVSTEICGLRTEILFSVWLFLTLISLAPTWTVSLFPSLLVLRIWKSFSFHHLVVPDSSHMAELCCRRCLLILVVHWWRRGIGFLTKPHFYQLRWLSGFCPLFVNMGILLM